MEIFATIQVLIAAHWVEVLALIGALDIILGIITKWTPTYWDDNLYAIFHNFVDGLVRRK